MIVFEWSSNFATAGCTALTTSWFHVPLSSAVPTL